MKKNSPKIPTPADADNATPRLALRAKDAAAALSISPRLLWSWTNQGKIPCVRFGRSVRYPVAALEAWLAEQSGMKK